MKFFKFLLFAFLLIGFSGAIKAQDLPQPVHNDTITLAQAYMNLFLTESYFDSLPVERIKKILAYESEEIKSISTDSFITANSTLYNFTNALFYQNQAKLLSLNKADTSRASLRRLKSVLGHAIYYYNSSKIDDFQTFQNGRIQLYEMINFDSEANARVKTEIKSLKKCYNSLFNEDIYPDFKRIFLKAKKADKFHIDSLIHFAGIYDMPLSMEIRNNTRDFHPFTFGDPNFINPEYTADSKLDILSRYVQLKQLASRRTRVSRNFNKTILYDAYDDFVSRVSEVNDKFIKEELSPEVLDQLFEQISNKFPQDKKLEEMEPIIAPSAMMNRPPVEQNMYFFPNPAPLASAKFITTNYKPTVSTLGQVDSFLRSNFLTAGFNNQLHYYYAMDGFALTTSLEKFNLDGSKVAADKRFSENLGGDGKFSYYEVFKSMFFNVESEFRMFAFIIASKSASMSSDAMSTSFAEQLLKNSYETLPEGLKNISLPNKTLSVFVYHFHQNDIGEVPELDLSGKLTVQDHLKNAGLLKIIE